MISESRQVCAAIDSVDADGSDIVVVLVFKGNDCAIELKLPADGPYLIELFDADNRSGGDYNYRLTFRRL